MVQVPAKAAREERLPARIIRLLRHRQALFLKSRDVLAVHDESMSRWQYQCSRCPERHDVSSSESTTSVLNIITMDRKRVLSVKARSMTDLRCLSVKLSIGRRSLCSLTSASSLRWRDDPLASGRSRVACHGGPAVIVVISDDTARPILEHQSGVASKAQCTTHSPRVAGARGAQILPVHRPLAHSTPRVHALGGLAQRGRNSANVMTHGAHATTGWEESAYICGCAARQEAQASEEVPARVP